MWFDRWRRPAMACAAGSAEPETAAAGVALHDLMAMRPVRLRDALETGLRQPGGARRGRGRAFGSEFESIDRYLPGDDIRRIDWIATARTGQAQVRRAQAEAHRAAMIVVDLGPEMHFGTSGRTMAKTAALAAARLIWEAQLRDEPVGLALPGRGTTAPGRGRAHALRLLGELVEGHARPPSKGVGEDPVAALHAAAARLSRGDDLVVVGDPMGDTAGFADAARRRTGTLALTALIVEDPVMLEPVPPGSYPARDGLAGQAQVLWIGRDRRAAARAEAARRASLDVLRDAGWALRSARDLLPSVRTLGQDDGAAP